MSNDKFIDDLTPTEVQALRIQSLEADKQLLNERIFFLTHELCRINARLAITEFQTHPKP